jgi:outer membrane protein TolC
MSMSARALLALALLAAPAHAQESLPVVGWQEAIDRALARNPTAVVARQEIERADALVRQAQALWLPMLSGNGVYTRRDSNRLSNGAVVSPAGQYSGNLQLAVPLLAPQAWANSWHARDNQQVIAVNATEVRRQVAAAVGRTYLTVLLQHRQLEVVERARETARVHYQYAHTRLQGGLGNAIDDARAEQELRSTEAQVGSVQTALVRAQSALAILLSEDHLVDVRPGVELPALPAGEQAVEQARQGRPDVRALAARLEAARHLQRDNWAYYAPSLAAVVQAFRQTETPIQAPRGWQAQIVLSIPFYDGGLRYGVARERRVLEAESRVQWEAALRQVSVEVRSALEVLRRADESLTAARSAATAAETAAKLADQAYRAGATTNLELVDAERRARDAASQAALAEDAARQARLDLLVASGRFP